MNKKILDVFINCCLLCIISCSPEQKDADATLAGIPQRQLTEAELAIKNDTSKCVFTSDNGRVTVTMDNSINIPPPTPRGYFDYVVMDGKGNSITLTNKYVRIGGYKDEMTLAFYTNDGVRLNEVNEGVYVTDAYTYYGTGKVGITAKYMDNGNGYRHIRPLSGQKIYIKSMHDGTRAYEVIFCNFRMDWEYSENMHAPITLDGKILVIP